ncbi:MAG TPA: diphosphomevalonate decarboxylase [Thermoplasmata archaeon]|nr:diphosphomevalonate decarboxylase [Thermoplasmata archaeon]
MTYEASPNIALVKYWGVRDEELGLPYNSSISVTLAHLRTRTTVRFVPGLDEDRLRLNGRPAAAGPLESAQRFLDRVRERAGITTHAEVRSTNNFPTASGLASSASGFAALAGAASRAGGLTLSPAELSTLARLGSGSASRSIFGGFVEWSAGRRSDGRDCVAHPLFGPAHWRALVDVVVGVADAPHKEVRSAVAMQSSVRTSPLYADRQRALPGRIRRIRQALGDRDSARLFPLIIEECDEFRAVCESTVPTLDYLTGTSRTILEAVRRLNRQEGRAVVGYTHDAGAHVHLFALRRDLPLIRTMLRPLPGISRTWTLGSGGGGRYVRTPVR